MPKRLYYQGVRITRTLRYKVKDACLIENGTKADIFCGNKMFKLYFSLNKFKAVLYSDIQIFLQKTTFGEHKDSPSLTNCKSYFETILQ